MSYIMAIYIHRHWTQTSRRTQKTLGRFESVREQPEPISEREILQEEILRESSEHGNVGR